MHMIKRLASIDVFRALTMFLMVFVNDLDAVPKVPEWIKHVKENVDGLGFADTIFPAFLFIVGLSIPFSIKSRLDRGESRGSIFWHIALRSLALLIMGFYHVNLEDYLLTGALIPKAIWEIGITVAFFAIWLDYPKDMSPKRRLPIQIAGILLLVAAALVYQGGKPGAPEGLSPKWWGILGLIGWSYLICACIYLFSAGRFWVQVLAALFFIAFNVAFHAHLLGGLRDIHHYIWIVGNGSMPALTMGGVVTALLYTRALATPRITATETPAAAPAPNAPPTPGIAATPAPQSSPGRWYLIATLLGAALIALGFLVRPYGGISKNHDTPSWVCICMGISVCAFAFLTWLVDQKGHASWFNWVKPAGTSTLTCYLIPYLLYSIFMLFHFKYPYPFNEGPGGLIRSILVALFCVWVTGLLEKRRLRLKI